MVQAGDTTIDLSVKAMIFFEGTLLLLQKNDGEKVHHWEFPGGGLRRGENFLAALKREVAEETGLHINVDGIAGTWQYKKRNGQLLNGLIFMATTDKNDVCVSREHLTYAWVKHGELYRYPIHRSLHYALEQMKTWKAETADLLKIFVTAPHEVANE